MNVPDYEDFAWFGFWDALTGGNCRAILPAGGTEMEYCLDLSTDTFTTKAAHSLNDDDAVVFFPNAPAPLVAGTLYYVVNATTTTFQVADSPGDYALDLTAQASEPAVVSLIVVDDAANGQRVISLGPNATLHNAF